MCIIELFASPISPPQCLISGTIIHTLAGNGLEVVQQGSLHHDLEDDNRTYSLSERARYLITKAPSSGPAAARCRILFSL